MDTIPINKIAKQQRRNLGDEDRTRMILAIQQLKEGYGEFLQAYLDIQNAECLA